MKKIIFLLLLFPVGLSFLKAQEGSGSKRGEKIEALKIAFITQKMELTSDEAQKFWPVYTEYESEIKSVLANNKDDDVIENDERLLNIRKKFRPEFTRILGQVRMNKLFTVEKDFRKILLQRLKNRNNQQRTR